MSALLETLRQPQRLPRYGWLIGAWVLLMVSLPIVKVVAGETILMHGVALSVLLQAAAVAAILSLAWGWRATLRTLAVVGALGWFAEFVGSTTGFPFGAYTYTERLQPQLGHVPLAIPLAWFMLLPSAWAVADLLVGRRRLWAFVALSAAAFTAWDLFLDPQMVYWKLWTWETPGGYFGIPWVNYLGWLLVSGAMTAVVRPRPVPHRPLLLIYAITWALQTIGLGLFWGLIGPALSGGVVMGLFVLLSWRQLRRQHSPRLPERG